MNRDDDATFHRAFSRVEADDKTAGTTTLATLSLALMSNSATGLAGAPLQTFHVTDNIQVHATNATATLTNATNSYTMSPKS